LLLATGPLLVPLIPWAIRHRSQTKKRKRGLKKAISEFHLQYPHLYMRWNIHSLTIERRPSEEAAQEVVQAHLIGDVTIPVEPLVEEQQPQQQQHSVNVPPAPSAANNEHAVV
jgi:hypothetical protein